MVRELQNLIETYPAIRAKTEEAAAAHADVEAADADRLPTIQFSADGGWEHTDSPSLSLWRKKGALTVTQNLFDGFKTKFNVKAGEFTEQIARMDLAATRQSILFRGIQSYLDVILQKKLVDISERNVAIVTKVTQFIGTETDVGRMTTADLLQARARLERAREALITAQGALRQSIARYQTLFRNPPGFSEMQDPVAPVSLMPRSIEDAIRFARANSPLLKGARFIIEAAAAQREAAASGYMPTVDLEGAASTAHNVDGATTVDQEGSILLKFSWDLFSGFKTRSQVSAAAHRYSAAMEALHDQSLQVDEQVRTAWATVDTQGRRLESLMNAEDIAVQAFDARHALMKAGKESIIAVLDTSLELLSVSTAATAADYGYRLAVHQLLLVSGELTPETLDKVVIGAPLESAAARIPSLEALLSSGDDEPVSGKGEDVAIPVISETLEPPPLPLQAPPPPEPLVPEPELASTGVEPGYFVALGSFTETGNALDRRELVSFENVRVQRVHLFGRDFQRLTVGPFDWSAARRTKQRAIDRGAYDAWIVPDWLVRESK